MIQSKDPINLKKIILASLSYLVIYPKQLLMASLIPIALILPFIFELQTLINQGFFDNELPTISDVSYGFLFLLLLAFLGFCLLSINIYRLVATGGGVGRYGLTYPQKLWQFIYTITAIQVLITLSILLTGLPISAMIVYMIIAPMALNLVRFALGKDKHYYHLDLNTRFKLTILQIIIPSLVLMAVSLLHNSAIILLFKFILTYWELITLALCYKAIRNAMVF